VPLLSRYSKFASAGEKAQVRQALSQGVLGLPTESAPERPGE